MNSLVFLMLLVAVCVGVLAIIWFFRSQILRLLLFCFLVVLPLCILIQLFGWVWVLVGLSFVVLSPLLAALIGSLRLVIVQEEKAVAFKYLGGFVYMAMEYTGFSFDSDGFIVNRPGSNSFGRCWCIWRIGGWVFYLYPFVEPANYEDYNNPDQFGEGIYVHLGDTTTEPFLVQAETTESDGSEIALNVKFVSTKRIVHPYRWLFRSPKDADNQVIRRENAVSRAWVNSGDRKHTQSAKGNGTQVWKEIVALNQKPIFDKIRNDWGQEILENSILVEDVQYDPDYQQALKAKSQQELLAKGETARLFDPIKAAMSSAYGLTKDEAIKIRSQGLAGGNFTLIQTDDTVDVTSGRQPISPNFAGGLAFAQVIGKAVARALGGGRKGSGGGSGNPSSSGRAGKSAGQSNAGQKDQGEKPPSTPSGKVEKQQKLAQQITELEE